MKPMTDLMFEPEDILKIYAKRYPLMQPTDAVKLEDLERLGRNFADAATRNKGALDSFLDKLRRCISAAPLCRL